MDNKKLSSEELRKEIDAMIRRIADNMGRGDGRYMFMIADDGEGTSQAMVGNIKNIGEAMMRAYVGDEDTRKMLSLIAKTIITFEMLGPDATHELINKLSGKSADLSNVKAEA